MNKLLVVAVLATAMVVVASDAADASLASLAPAAADRGAAMEQPAHEPAAQEEHAAEEHGMLYGLIGPVVNFAILAGGLWWFLKQPITQHLADRHTSIRRDLVEAANVKNAATAELKEIERKLEALPGVIEALKRRGAEEIAAEEQRIATAAVAERERLLEQTRREIELQVRLAKRELLEHAADLAVQLATARIQKTITPADQERLVDRYLEQVKKEGRA